jgi:hypothetical protein
LEDKLASLTSRLGVALTTLHRLEKINSLFISKGFSTDREFQTVADDLTYHITGLEGNLESVNVLERKVRAISDLVRYLNHLFDNYTSLPGRADNQTLTECS